jgi:hypothetical protein
VYLAIPPQPDCANAWLEAVSCVNALSGQKASNVIIDIADPTSAATLSHPVVAKVNDFLLARGKKAVETVANTIFPQALYQRYKLPAFIEAFHTRVLRKVRINIHWSGYYFERMTYWPVAGDGKPIDQLSRMIERINDKKNTSLNKHEIALFDPSRDVTGSPYGGQCLSFLSFHLTPAPSNVRRTLLLTAQYRNHYYMEKLLGNLIGLGRLMEFVATETGTEVGALTVISTHAEVDTLNASRAEISQFIEICRVAMPSQNLSLAIDPRL